MAQVVMRLVLAFAVMLASAMPAAAQTAPDRYGARTLPYAAAPLRGAVQGPMLSWANKRLPGPADAEPATASLRGAPVARTQGQAYRPQAPLSMSATGPARAKGADLPASLYDTAPAPSTPAPAPVATAAPAPQKLAEASNLLARRAGETRLYSVHRPYGLTPDAIPAAQAGEHYVLIGPPDSPKARAADSGSDSDDENRPF